MSDGYGTELLEEPSGGITDNCCPQCESAIPQSSPWCTSCGFFPKFGTYVEVEPEEDDTEEPTTLLGLIPGWLWGLLAGSVVLVGQSFAVRLLTPDDSTLRFVWTVAQLAAGGFLIFSSHIIAYVNAIMEDDLTLFDVVVRPITVWKHTFRSLPVGRFRLIAMVWGVFAVIAALLVVDGLPWAQWMADRPPPRRGNPILKAIANSAGMAPSSNADSLEEAIKDFTDEADVDDLQQSQGDGEKEEEQEEVGAAGEEEAEEDEKKEEEKKEDEEPVDPVAKAKAEEEAKKLDERLRPETTECVIIGYKPKSNDGFYWLALAAARNGKLEYVGKVATGFDPRLEFELRSKLQNMERERSVVTTNVVDSTTRWVRPAVTCKVRFRRWGGKGRMLISPKFMEVLKDLEQGKPQSTETESPDSPAEEVVEPLATP